MDDQQDDGGEWRCVGYTTRGGRNLSIGKGWDHQRVSLAMRRGEHEETIVLTPHGISDWLALTKGVPAEGFQLPGLIADMTNGEIAFNDADLRSARGFEVAGETPDNFPMPGPIPLPTDPEDRKILTQCLWPEEMEKSHVLSRAGDSAFGGISLHGGHQDLDNHVLLRPSEAILRYGELPRPPRPSGLEHNFGVGRPFGRWMHARIRRLRQRAPLWRTCHSWRQWWRLPW